MFISLKVPKENIPRYWAWQVEWRLCDLIKLATLAFVYLLDKYIVISPSTNPIPVDFLIPNLIPVNLAMIPNPTPIPISSY